VGAEDSKIFTLLLELVFFAWFAKLFSVWVVVGT
jgi:hypothetical protein